MVLTLHGAHLRSALFSTFMFELTCIAATAQAVTRSEGEALAKSYGIPFYETSAKRGTGVDAAFQGVAQLVVRRLGGSLPGAAHSRDTTSITHSPDPPAGGCGC